MHLTVPPFCEAVPVKAVRGTSSQSNETTDFEALPGTARHCVTAEGPVIGLAKYENKQ
jgi:hypothetical protein